jgi:signal transduction histidine kinase
MSEIEDLQKRVQKLENELAEVRARRKAELHELRTPLIPLKGFINTLLDDENEEWYIKEDRREFYTIIRDNVEQMERLVREFLEGVPATKVSAGILMRWQRDVDVRQEIEIAAVSPRHGRDPLKLILEMTPEHIFIETDTDRFAQIICNLIAFVEDLSPKDKEIRLSARSEPADVEFPDGSLVLQVHARELKTDQQSIALMWKRSAQKMTPNPYSSLMILRWMAALHHGVAWVESQGGGAGTIVGVRLPLRQPEQV